MKQIVGGRVGSLESHLIESTRSMRWLELTVLTSFAISQPILSLIGNDATFLVAHGLAGFSVVLYATWVLVTPAAIAIGIDEVLHVLPSRQYAVLGNCFRAGLIGMIIAPHLSSLGQVETWGPFLAIFAGVSALSYWVLITRPSVRAIARYAAVAPLVFLGWFVVATPASALLASNPDIEDGAVTESDTSVVWLVFDQFPLPLLMQSDGSLATSRFPNFARLADRSTWYPNATTVSTATQLSIPSMLTGRYADYESLPVVSNYPSNLFTILGRSHSINATQSVTQLCPDSLCANAFERPVVSGSGLLRDSVVIATRLILPDRAADRIVPEIDDRWAGFGSPATDTIDLSIENEATTADDIRDNRVNGIDDTARVADFLQRLASYEEPAVHYLHVEKPHEPIVLLPDGRAYDYCTCDRKTEDFAWPVDPEMTTQRLQRYLLQALYVDNIVGQVLAIMDESGLSERAVLVVMSDHGAALEPGMRTRGATPGNVNDVIPIPLFVSSPGQTSGAVDNSQVQSIDVLPTVLDELGIDPSSFHFDGVTLSDEAERPPRIISSVGVVPLPKDPDPVDSTLPEWLATLFPEPFDPYRWGSNHGLYGRETADLVVGESDLTASIRNLEQMESVEDANDSYVPAHMIGKLVGAERSVDLAVGVNGRIAGTGTTFLLDDWVISTMIAPTTLRGGHNVIELFEVTDEGLLLIDYR